MNNAALLTQPLEDMPSLVSQPLLKITLVSRGEDGVLFCGHGMIKLLRSIRETGSVRDAAEKMGVSYGKAWKLLDRFEKYLGAQAVARQQGGKGGGKSALTEEGERFLDNYTAFAAECKREVERIYAKYYETLS